MTVGELRAFLDRYADEREVIAAMAGAWYEIVGVRSIEPGGSVVAAVGSYIPQETVFAEKQVAK